MTGLPSRDDGQGRHSPMKAGLRKGGGFLFDWPSMSAVDFSRALGRLLKRPILVVNLADLPYEAEASFAPLPLTTRARGALDTSARMRRARLLRDTRRAWEARGRILKDLACQTFPDDVTDASWKRWKWARIAGQPPGSPDKTAGKIWKHWKWTTISARITTPTNDALRAPGKPYHGEAVALPPRLDGEAWTQAAIIFTPSRTVSTQRLWRDIAGLDDPQNRWPDRLERWPKGDAIRHYIFLHELGHVLQRQELERGFVPRDLPRARRWLSELDADRFAFAQMERQARRLVLQGGAENLEAACELRETVIAIRHTRALQAFLKYPPTYCIAPAFDLAGPSDSAQAARVCEDSYLAAYELRLRVYALARAKEAAKPGAKTGGGTSGPGIPKDSASLRALLAEWFAGKPVLPKDMHDALAVSPFNWAGECDVARTIPLLREIVRSGEIAPDSTAARLAGLVLEAADYLCPGVAGAPQALKPSGPQILSQPRPIDQPRA